MLTIPKPGKPKSLPIENLILETEYYPRIHRDWQTEARYADAMRNGDVFPPVAVVPDGHGQYVVLDGFHRVAAAQRAGKTSILAAVYRNLPRKQWFVLAVALNKAHGRCLTTQDRAMIANRLQRLGYSVDEMARLISVTADKFTEFVASRTSADGEAVKGPVREQLGTRNEARAVAHSGTFAAADVRRILDQTVGALRGKIVDVSVPDIRERAEFIHDALGKLLRKK